MHMYVCMIMLYLGLHVTEVAHDYQPQVKRFIVDELGLVNSFDTWHGDDLFDYHLIENS